MINLNIDYNKYNLLKEKGIIKEINDPIGRKYTFFLNIGNKSIFFKECSREGIVNELIIDDICKLFNKDVLEQKYGYITDKYNRRVYGLISNNYKLDNYVYISLDTILSDYYVYITNNNINYEGIRIYELINLETIWQALEYRYRNNTNHEKIVKSLMEELTSRFLIDILTGQNDRHEFNIEIKENNNDVSLANIYDNEEGLAYDKFDMGVTMDSLKYKGDYMLNLLNEFFDISDSKYIDLFNSMLDKLNIDKFKLIVNNIKFKTSELGVSDNYFDELINKYSKYYNEYKSIVNKRLR